MQRFLLAVVFLFSFSSAAWSAPEGKPSGPISLRIELARSGINGEASDFRVVGSSAVASDNFVIRVHPPTGFILTEGTLVWKGSVLRNELVAFTFSGIARERGNGVITATASFDDGPGRQFGTRATLQLSAPNAKANGAPGRRLKRDGQPVLEVPLKP